MRVYLLIYNMSCEEAKYLAGVRREKDAFERLIKERGVRAMSFSFVLIARLTKNAI